MQGKNSGVTERAVYWPRKCSQAAGQSAWLNPPVSLTAHWPMKAVLYSLFQSTPHTIKEEPFIFPFHRPHTQLPPLSLSQTLDPSLLLSFSAATFTICLSVSKNAFGRQKRTNKNLQVQQMWRQTKSNSVFFPPYTQNCSCRRVFPSMLRSQRPRELQSFNFVISS